MWALIVFYHTGPIVLSGFPTQAAAVTAARTINKIGGDIEQPLSVVTVQVT